jgi:hypothetical protein
MEASELANGFMGTNTFIVLVAGAISAIALILRLTFRSADKEYKHKDD